MRDLFSQYTCVHTYVHTCRSCLECQFVVSLRDVNLRSTVTPRQDIGYHVHYTTTSGRRFLAMEHGEDSTAGPLQRIWQSQVQKRVLNAADG